MIKIRICILIYHFSIRWFPVFLVTWNFIILRKDSGKNNGPENLSHFWWSRQLKLADSSDETLKPKPCVTVNEPSLLNCSYQQRWTGHKAIRNQSIKMNMLLLWCVILCCMVYTCMMSGYKCKCKEKDSCHTYGCSNSICDRIKYWHFILYRA